MNNIVLNKIMTLIVIVGVVILTYMGLSKLMGILLPFIIGFLLSMAIYPLARWINKHFKLPHALGSVVLILGLIGLASFMVYLLVQLSIRLIGAFAEVLPYWSSLISAYGNEWTSALNDFFVTLPFNPVESLSTSLSSVLSNIGQYASTVASKGLGLMSSLPNLLISIIITILSAFFFTKDRVAIFNLVRPYYDKYIKSNAYWQSFKRDVIMLGYGYFKAQLILMSLTFIINAIGLTIIGIPNSILVALGIGLIDALPLFGPAIIYMPWAFSMLLTGHSTLALQLFVMYLVTTLSRQFIEPKIVSTQIGMHPLLTLLGLYLGVRILGLPGLIIGPLTMVFLVTLYKKHVTKSQVAD